MCGDGYTDEKWDKKPVKQIKQHLKSTRNWLRVKLKEKKRSSPSLTGFHSLLFAVIRLCSYLLHVRTV